MLKLPAGKNVLIICALLTAFFSNKGIAQKHKESFNKEISITSDNDNYLYQLSDGYYTNGLFIRFNHLVKTRSKAGRKIKTIHSWEAGQQIFNPSSWKTYSTEQIDRPLTGYLFAKFTNNQFYKNEQQLQWAVSVGTIGKAALGEEVQKWYHKFIDIYQTRFWAYQLKTEPGINAHFAYAASIFPDRNKKIVDVTPFVHATVGTTFTNASGGLNIRIGVFETMAESAFFNARLNNRNSSKSIQPETFIYFKPRVYYHVYNATVQGGMFIKDKGEIVKDVHPLMYAHNIGFLHSAGHWTIDLAGSFQTKEAIGQVRQHRYGSIRLAYSFN